ncbi:MAG: hypothetical protein LUH20_03205, partial [Lachnospiraceae bacterium]|nr:hypothetical protein [Lachnospiraceae bacterium]
KILSLPGLYSPADWETYSKFAIQIEYYKSQLEEFDRCVSVLNRIDKEAGRDSGEISKNISSSPTQQKHSAPPEKMQKKRNAYER